jgi:sugar lactone lactonase YvrE
MRRYTATPATAEPLGHAEGPMWDARTDRFVFVDQYAGEVHVADYDASTASLTTERSYDLGAAVGAVVPLREPGAGWLVAWAQGFGHVSQDGTVTAFDQPEPRSNRMNDGKCDPAGRFWAGSIGWEKTPGAASLYRLDPDGAEVGELTVVLRDVTISNGLAWTPDGVTMYYIDTPTGRVDRFQVRDDGSLAHRTPVIEVDGGDPDGMCIDDDGCVWVALWGGGAVHHYAPTGELLAVVEVDAQQVSSCCLGGPRGSTLFVTTSQEGMSAEQCATDPHSGKVFSVEVDITGRPAAAFGTPPPGMS